MVGLTIYLNTFLLILTGLNVDTTYAVNQTSDGESPSATTTALTTSSPTELWEEIWKERWGPVSIGLLTCGGSGLLTLLVVGIILCCCCHRRRSSRLKTGSDSHNREIVEETVPSDEVVLAMIKSNNFQQFDCGSTQLLASDSGQQLVGGSKQDLVKCSDQQLVSSSERHLVVSSSTTQAIIGDLGHPPVSGSGHQLVSGSNQHPIWGSRQQLVNDPGQDGARDSDQLVAQGIQFRDSSGSRGKPVSVVQPFKQSAAASDEIMNKAQVVQRNASIDNTATGIRFTKGHKCTGSDESNRAVQAKSSVLISPKTTTGTITPSAGDATGDQDYEFLDRTNRRRRFKPFTPLESPGLLKTVKNKYLTDESETEKDDGTAQEKGQESKPRKFVYDLAGPFRAPDVLRQCRTDSSEYSTYELPVNCPRRAPVRAPVEIPASAGKEVMPNGIQEQRKSPPNLSNVDECISLGRSPLNIIPEHGSVPIRIRLDYDDYYVDEESVNCPDEIPVCFNSTEKREAQNGSVRMYTEIQADPDTDTNLSPVASGSEMIIPHEDSDEHMLVRVGSIKKAPVKSKGDESPITDPSSMKIGGELLYSNHKIKKSKAAGKDTENQSMLKDRETGQQGSGERPVMEEAVRIIFEENFAQKQLKAAANFSIVYAKKQPTEKIAGNKAHVYEEIQVSEEAQKIPDFEGARTLEASKMAPDKNIGRRPDTLPISLSDRDIPTGAQRKPYDHLSKDNKSLQVAKTTRNLYDHFQLPNTVMLATPADVEHRADDATFQLAKKTLYSYASRDTFLPQQMENPYDHIQRQSLQRGMRPAVIRDICNAPYSEVEPGGSERNPASTTRAEPDNMSRTFRK